MVPPKPGLYTINVHTRSCIVYLHRTDCSDVKKNINTGNFNGYLERVKTGWYAPVEGNLWERTYYNTWLDPLPLIQVLEIIIKMQCDPTYYSWRKWYRCIHCIDIFTPMITLTKENLSLLIKALHHYNILTKNSQTTDTETIGEELRKLASKWSNLEFLAHNADVYGSNPLYLYHGEKPSFLKLLILPINTCDSSMIH